jgi:serine/threonine protein kinase
VPPGILTIGTVLDGTYRIDRLLAGGGCGDVYVATHLRLRSEVAVKVLLPTQVGNSDALARLRREADIMSTLRHPHVVQILDFNVTADGIAFLVMELLGGWPLTGRTAAGPAFEPRAALHIVEQIADALAAAHAQGIVHLDLKPDNVILVPTDGRGDFVKVIDFGISQATWRERLANDPLIAGTPEYMAPEQVGGVNAEIDHRADQFSLAALSYRLLTGHEPFSRADPFAILQKVINETQPPPSHWSPGLSAAVDAVINRAMSKRQDERYPDVLAFADALGVAVAPVAFDGWPIPRPLWTAVPEQIERPVAFAERDTLRAPGNRRVTLARMSRVVMLALSAAAAFLWFFPGTRAIARATWSRATAHARRALVAGVASRAAGP